MLWLDHLIFGNGHGMKSPHWDNKFYWLSGRLYTWSAGFGAQLTNFQWTHPKPGERRTLNRREYRPFQSHRSFLWIGRDGWLPIPTPISRVSVSWATSLSSDINVANSELRIIKHELDNV